MVNIFLFYNKNFIFVVSQLLSIHSDITPTVVVAKTEEPEVAATTN